MATFSTTAVEDPRISLGDHDILPPIRGGGGDDGSGPGLPDYATRLRRARLGLLVALTPILMLFVSFSSAYVVRQGLPTLDPRTNALVRDWIPVTLPKLLLINTGVLILSSVFMELARRQIKRLAALASAKSAPRVSVVDQVKIPWLAMTFVLGLVFLFGQWEAWRQLAANGFYVATTPRDRKSTRLNSSHGYISY